MEQTGQRNPATAKRAARKPRVALIKTPLPKNRALKTMEFRSKTGFRPVRERFLNP